MCAVKVSVPNTSRERAVAHVEAAGIGAERRHHQRVAVAGEAAAADRAAAPRHPRDRMQVAGDLAAGVLGRLVAEGQRAERERRAGTARRCPRPGRDRGCRRSRSSRGRAAAPQRGAVGVGEPRRPAAVVEAVAQRHHDARRIARDQRAQAAPASPRCRRAAAARRGRRSSSLFRDADRRPPAGPAPANR